MPGTLQRRDTVSMHDIAPSSAGLRNFRSVAPAQARRAVAAARASPCACPRMVSPFFEDFRRRRGLATVRKLSL